MTASSGIALATMAVAIVSLAAYLRFEGLGTRSLWADELSTWHVSRMDVGPSLRWGPELTKPPLYQLTLRAITRAPRPSEATLRLPAAVCGLLVVAAGCWLGWLGGGCRVGFSLALLLAVNGLQVAYSREARPYSMLVLFSTLSTIGWYRLVIAPSWRRFLAYTAAAGLGFYVHYLFLLTILAHASWVAVLALRRRTVRGLWYPLAGLGLVGLLCVPLVYRYLSYRSSLFQGLDWIGPPTVEGTRLVLDQLTFGWQWTFGLLGPLVILWGLVSLGVGLVHRWRDRTASVVTGTEDVCGLLFAWFLWGTLGLLVLSWLAQPAMVVRYALPAAVPMLAFPLVVAYRLYPHAAVVIAAVFTLAAAPDWLDRSQEPGCREMAAYFDSHVDPEESAVVLVIDAPPAPAWRELDRLPFRYYPLRRAPMLELAVDAQGRPLDGRTLRDPRALYLVVFRADPSMIVEDSSRRLESIMVDGTSYDQLLFAPYRVARVAPFEGG